MTRSLIHFFKNTFNNGINLPVLCIFHLFLHVLFDVFGILIFLNIGILTGSKYR